MRQSSKLALQTSLKLLKALEWSGITQGMGSAMGRNDGAHYKMKAQTHKQKRRDLKRLARLARKVSGYLTSTSTMPLTPKQEQALYNAFRTLDIINEYKVGDALRTAFGVELDAVAWHKKLGKY